MEDAEVERTPNWVGVGKFGKLGPDSHRQLVTAACGTSKPRLHKLQHGSKTFKLLQSFAVISQNSKIIRIIIIL